MDTKLQGKTFVVTGALEGFTRIEIGEFIESHAGKMGESVSTKTDYLVVGDKPGASKLNKALDLGTKIITLNVLLGMCK
jgi:DNA ligase (NAD+)